MRQFGVIILILVTVGCKHAAQERSTADIPKDTVYDGDIIRRENLETKRPMIQFDNGQGDRPTFVIGDTSILRIHIPRFLEYDIHLNNIVGATIVKIDSASNKFLVIPQDNQFSFVLSQSYPKGQVIRYTRNWNEAKAAYDEQIVPLDGMIQIGKFDFKAVDAHLQSYQPKSGVLDF